MKCPNILCAFGHALDGIKKAFKEERNLRIHLIIAVVVIIGGLILNVSSSKMLIILLAIGLVISAELFNAVIERVMDFIQLEEDPRIKVIKDMAAGAVLIASIVALIIGIIIVAELFIK